MPGDLSTGVTSGARRLAAIMSADIAGFSRLMEHDEEGTHARLKRVRRDIIEPTVAEHNGHIVKHVGDGFLAIFDSPLEATRCAIVIQQTIAARNAGVAKDLWLRYRIGINLGDVLVELDDIYGDGVNIAARLQTAASPGEVNISGGVYEQVKNKLVCGYQSLGDEKLKNITDPVRIYRVLPDPAAVGSARPVRRVMRIGVLAVAALAVAFGGGLWVANRSNVDHRAPAAASSDTPTPSPATPALAEPTVAAGGVRIRAGHLAGPAAGSGVAASISHPSWPRAAGGNRSRRPRRCASPARDTRANRRRVLLPRLSALSGDGEVTARHLHHG